MDSYTNMIKKEMRKAEEVDLRLAQDLARLQASQNVAQQQAEAQQRLSDQAQAQQQNVADQNARDLQNIVRYDVYPTVAAQVQHNQGHSHGGQPGAHVVGSRPMGRRPHPPGPGRGPGRR